MTQELSVLIYNEDRNGQWRVVAKGLTAEDACNIIARELKITPLMLYYFGLRKYTETEKMGYWLAPSETLNTCSNGVEIHFRMRFLPDKDKCNSLLIKDPNCFTYLFWQVNWDFLNDRLQCFKDKSKVDTARGFTVLLILISLRLKHEKENSTEDLIFFKKNTHLNDFLPKSLQKFFLDKLILQNSIYNKVKEYQEYCPAAQYDSKSVMRIYLGNILRQNQSYYEETFQAFQLIPPSKNDEEISKAETTVQKQKLEIRVEMGCQEPKLRAIVLDNSSEVMSCLIKDLNQIEVHEQLSDTTGINDKQWVVRLLRTNGHPQDLYFDAKDEMQSFVTCLESFYRLMFDFYGSLNADYEPKQVKELFKIPAHGPISEDGTKRKLKKKNNKDCYVVRASLKVYDQYEILYQKSEMSSLKYAVLGTLILKLEVCEGGYRISGDNSSNPTELRVLINKLTHKCALVPHTSVPMRPQNEACDELQFMLISGDFKMMKEDEEQQRAKRKQENQPKVYTLSHKQIHSLIGQSSFTETHSVHLNDHETLVIKELRMKDIKTGHFSTVLESFQIGIQTLMNLNEPQYFIGFLGVAFCPNLSMLMEEATHGSLRNFLQNRNIATVRLTLHHLVDAAVQLTQALIYMDSKNLYHSNIHCDNILVVRHSTSRLIVKLSDPGMVSLYNKLPISHQLNMERLPWLAPELHKDIENVHVPHNKLGDVTIETEIYAWSTTLWQMFSGGHSPLTHDCKLIRKDILQLLNFYKEGNVLSCPEYLIDRLDDPKEIRDIKSALQQQMKDCWVADSQLRPAPKTLLRKLLSNMQSNEETYHKYNIIPENCPEIVPSNGPQQHPLLASSGCPNYAMRKPVGDLSCLDAQGANKGNSQNSVVTEKQRLQLDAKDNLLVHLGPMGAGDNKKSLLEQQKNDKDSKGVHVLMPPRPNNFVMRVISENSQLTLTVYWAQTLGQGHYGAVYKGTLKLSSGDQDVVVKALKPGMISKYSEDFKKEALIMEKLHHKNIVKFYGSCNDGAYLVMEFVENNSLANYMNALRTSRNMTQQQFLQLALDIAEGMEYLSSENIVHCDLAARNVLLTKEIHAKVSDFGLAKILAKDKEYYRKEKGTCLPIFWCSTEVIEYHKFSSKSDVWSYGVVLWEMYSYGKSPNVKPFNDPKNLAKCLHDGKRLEKPQECPEEIYKLMMECWEANAEKRPTFTKCCSNLKKYPLQSLCQNNNSIIAKNDLEIDPQMLAKGSFGAVHKASYNGQTVAVKRCMNIKEYQRFKREFELLFQLGNPYIVRFIGICRETEEVTGSCYVMEYLSGGTLRNHVNDCKKNGNPEPIQNKLKYLIQVAEGMNYLMNKCVIHGDLTAENILLTADKRTAKICDFGFAKKLDDMNTHYTRKEASFKVRWAAPEVLREQYTISSDIWSYGIVCTEVFLDGESPNWPPPDQSLLLCINKPGNFQFHYDKLARNERFPCPEGCPLKIYQIILYCWKFKEEERIHYDKIITKFSRFIETMNPAE